MTNEASEDDNTFCCHHPGCLAERKGSRKPLGWTHIGYFICCPEHGPELEDADVVIQDAWGDGPIVGFDGVSEKGTAFLAAYDDLPEEEEGCILSGSIFPDELPKFRRMAAYAGVRLLDWTRAGRD